MTSADLEAADECRLTQRAAEAERDDVAIIEIVCQGKWVRFDLALMQLRFWTPDQLVERGLQQAFEAVGVRLPLGPAESSALSASSETNV